MPGGGERPGLGLAVADDARDDQIGVVERHAVGVREAVAELAAFVDRARRLRRDVAADVPGKGELLEELLQPFRVLALVRIDLRVGPFEIGRPEHARRAVAGAGHEDHVEVVLDDQSVQVHPDEGQRRARAPVPEQPVLHVVGLQRLAAAAGCPSGRSSPPTGSCRPASRRPSVPARWSRAARRRRSSVLLSTRSCVRTVLSIRPSRGSASARQDDRSAAGPCRSVGRTTGAVIPGLDVVG